MDGRGRALDNIFVERLWRTVKYEDVYLHGYAAISELQVGLTGYFMFYNTERRHQALNYRTPDVVYQTASGGGARIVDKFGETKILPKNNGDNRGGLISCEKQMTILNSVNHCLD